MDNEPASSQVEDWSTEDLDQVVLMDATLEDGTQGKIVYRNGGMVDAVELENLCDKVGAFIIQHYVISWKSSQ